MSHTYGQTGTSTYAASQGQTTYSAGQTQHAGHHHGAVHVLNDRDILTDLLLCAKQLLSAYGTAAIESTHPQLRQTLQHISQKEAEFHKQVFEMMQQRGWYDTPRSDPQLARQIASVWTQQMQRPGHEQQAHGQPNQHQAYGTQAPTQSWPGQPTQHGDGTAWQQGWSGSGHGQPGSWQTGHAAAKTWEQTPPSPSGTSPGAHT